MKRKLALLLAGIMALTMLPVTNALATGAVTPVFDNTTSATTQLLTIQMDDANGISLPISGNVVATLSGYGASKFSLSPDSAETLSVSGSGATIVIPENMITDMNGNALVTSGSALVVSTSGGAAMNSVLVSMYIRNCSTTLTLVDTVTVTVSSGSATGTVTITPNVSEQGTIEVTIPAFSNAWAFPPVAGGTPIIGIGPGSSPPFQGWSCVITWSPEVPWTLFPDNTSTMMFLPNTIYTACELKVF